MLENNLHECDIVCPELFEPVGVSFVNSVGADNAFINDGSSTTGCDNGFGTSASEAVLEGISWISSDSENED